MQTWPLNAWYVAAWDHEIGRKLLARKICGKPVVLYRCADGRAVALEDACWHRMLPLSLGKLQGDKVECGYHGLVYDPAGRCTHIPFQEKIPPSACVRAYPLVERNRMLWIWMGEPGREDPAKVPNLYWNDDPAWVGEPQMLHQQFDYRLVLDNLMDLTHETYVHGTTIGNRAVVEAPFETTHTQDAVTVSRWMLDVEAPPMWAAALGKPGRVDRWQIIKFQAPCIVTIDVGVALAGTGAPQGDRSQGITGYVVNTVTPETERAHFSFHLFTRNYRIGDQRLTRRLADTDLAILMEDKAVLEAQQKASEQHPGRRFVNLSIDAGAVQVRRILERMIADEKQAVPA
jgi:vanillate O-demethylase monooxygenase subunit